MPHDLLLSSGFLAFARHVGVLHAVESRGIAIDAVVGTSSGALVGALWAAGHPAARIEALLGEQRPFALMGVHARVWTGAFSLDPLVTWLRARLPPTFADLPRPFAAGVVRPDGTPGLLREGPLAEAVAASCAIPYVFAPVVLGGARFHDGGVADRLMLEPWRAWRGDRSAVVHLVDRSAGRDPAASMEGLAVIRTPRSGATFWSLGDVTGGVALARERALAVLTEMPSEVR
ncbi:MAG: patatin-like phospholipase family protein [Myxococcota bacterium]